MLDRHFRMSDIWRIALPLSLFCALTAASSAEDLGLEAPPGFHVELFADDDLATNIYSLTVDAQGHVVVSGPGYVRRLLDDDGDGRAERSESFSELPASGAQGMYFDGFDLYCTGDEGLLWFCDADGDGRADGPPETLAELRNREHGAHGIVMGPDGWLYVACGNDAGVDVHHVERPNSPVLSPRSGTVLRVAPDRTTTDVFAHEFRNHFDLAFNAQGHLFTVDSDGERDQHLPWYVPTRVFDIAQGRGHGWINQGSSRSWSRPAAMFDSAARVAELGRGSPTGLIVYRHRAFPSNYRGGLFSCCWTLGRVYFVPLVESGASYASEGEIFLQTSGNVGFAPVDLAVGRDGELYVAIGGRGTRGGVFRVSYEGDSEIAVRPDTIEFLDDVLNAPQPDASWSRALWLPVARALGEASFVDAVVDSSRTLPERLRAVEILTELYDGLPDMAVRQVLDEPAEAALLARVAWSLGRSSSSPFRQRALAELTAHHDARVLRAAWEGLAAQEQIDEALEPAPGWFAGLASSSARVRSAVVESTRRAGAASFERAVIAFEGAPAPRQILGTLRIRKSSDMVWTTAEWDACLEIAADNADPQQRLDAVRLLQLALGDVQTDPAPPSLLIGYVASAPERLTPERRQKLAERLAASFPTRHAALDLELSRLLAMLAAPVDFLPGRLAERWTAETWVPDDLHYLMVLARVPGARSAAVTDATARALLALDAKMAAAGQFPSRTWPERVLVTFEYLLEHDPALATTMVKSEEFGRPEHALWVASLPEADQPAAARRLLAVATAADTDEDAAWTPELIDALVVLPDEELLPALRMQWHDFRLRDSIAMVLADRASVLDRDRLVEMLGSTQPEVALNVAKALLELPEPGTIDEVLAAINALRSYCPAGEVTIESDELEASVTSRLVGPYRPHRRALVRLLAHWTGHQFADHQPAAAELLGAYADWSGWLAETHPDRAAELEATGLADWSAWRDRLSGVDWTAGEKERGNEVFQQRSCHRCHAGNSRLGPDLTGVAQRMTREDLYAAIVDPSRDVAPPYRTTLIATRSGHIYHGVLVYDSPDGTLIQTGPDTTIRITGDDLAARQLSTQSLMPTGLLQGASDQELADLYEYLKSLTPESADAELADQ